MPALMRPPLIEILIGSAAALALAAAGAAQYALPVEGQELALELDPEQVVTLEAQLSAGEYLHIEVDQLTTNVAVELFAGDENVWQTDQRPWAAHSEWAFYRAVEATEVRMVLESLGTRTGAARVRVVARRSPTPQDLLRYRAETLFDQSRVERAQAAVSEEHVARAEQAAELFADLALPDRQSLALKRIGTLKILQGKSLEALQPLGEAIDVASEVWLRWEECYARLTWAEAVYARSLEEALAAERSIRDDFGEPETKACRLKNARLLVYDLGAAGAYREALEVFEEGLELAEELQAPRESTEFYMNAFDPYLALGELDLALDTAVKAYEGYTAQGREGLRWVALDNIAVLYHSIGAYQRAVELRNDLLAPIDQHGEAKDRIRIRIHLASTLVALSRFDEAAALYEAALRIAIALGDPHEIAGVEQAMAELALERSDYPSALELASAARTRLDEVGFASLSVALIEAAALEGSGKLQAATQNYRQISERAENDGDVHNELASRARAADLLWRRGDVAAAGRELERALLIAERVRATLPSPELRATFVERQRTLYDLAIQLALAANNEMESVESAFSIAEQARARSLRDFLDSSRGASRARIDAELVAREEELEHALERTLAKVAALRQESDASPEALAEASRAVRTAEAELDALLIEVLERHPLRGSFLRPAATNLTTLRSALGDRLLLSYHLGQNQGWLFALDADSLTVHSVPGLEQLREPVAALRTALARPSRFTTGFASASRVLWRLLLAPVEEHLEGRELVISADGPLHEVPFGALLRSDIGPRDSWADLDYLGKDQVISYVPSAQLLQQLQRPRPAPSRRLVAFADPQRETAAAARRWASRARGATLRIPARAAADIDDLELPSLPEFGPLPNARREVESVASLFRSRFGTDSVVQFVGTAATEARARSAPGDASIVHFATHAIVDPHYPAHSALVLGADGEDDGLLRLREVLRMQIDADLVVLSACSTATGEVVLGEGVTSLARAFFYAGASSLLASLWDVADEATSTLMTDFYRRLLDGSSKAAALHAAQRTVATRKETAHPYYWAAFQILGDSGRTVP